MSKICDFIQASKVKRLAYKNVQDKKNAITVPVFEESEKKVACLQMVLFFPNGLTSTHVDVMQQKCDDFSEIALCNNTACPMFEKNQEYIHAVAEYDKARLAAKSALKRIFVRGK